MHKGDSKSLLVAADLADDDDWRRRLRALVAQRDKKALEHLAESMGTDQPPANVQRLARALREVASPAAAERLLRVAQRRHPDDFWLNFDLAEVLLNQ